MRYLSTDFSCLNTVRLLHSWLFRLLKLCLPKQCLWDSSVTFILCTIVNQPLQPSNLSYVQVFLYDKLIIRPFLYNLHIKETPIYLYAPLLRKVDIFCDFRCFKHCISLEGVSAPCGEESLLRAGLQTCCRDFFSHLSENVWDWTLAELQGFCSKEHLGCIALLSQWVAFVPIKWFFLFCISLFLLFWKW